VRHSGTDKAVVTPTRNRRETELRKTDCGSKKRSQKEVFHMRSEVYAPSEVYAQSEVYALSEVY